MKPPKIIAIAAASIAVITAASFALHPSSSLAGTDNGKGNGGQNNGLQLGRGDPPISSVPEANTGVVLIPFVGAVLLFSLLQLRKKAQQT